MDSWFFSTCKRRHDYIDRSILIFEKRMRTYWTARGALLSTLCADLNGKKRQKKNAYGTHTADPLLCAAENSTTWQRNCVCLCVCAHVLSHSVMSTWLRSHGLQPTRLLCPWNFPGKNTGAGCHFLRQQILPDSGIKHMSLASPALTSEFLITEPPGKPKTIVLQ